MAPKKSVRNKGKTVALGEFLQETPGIIQALPIRRNHSVDEDFTDEEFDAPAFSAKPNKLISLPSGPRASRELNVPNKPPYLVNLSNLPYDADEEAVFELFKNTKVFKLSVPQQNGRLRGYGQVEFEDYDSLLRALLIPEPAILARRIKIEPTNEKKRFDDDSSSKSRNDGNWRNSGAGGEHAGNGNTNRWGSNSGRVAAESENGGSGGRMRQNVNVENSWRNGPPAMVRDRGSRFSSSRCSFDSDNRSSSSLSNSSSSSSGNWRDRNRN